MNILSFSKLSKTYSIGANEVHALASIDLAVKQNEMMAIIGPSGSGKSTMLNILGCLDSPSKGEYFLNGNAVHGLTDKEKAEIRNQEIGFIFQNFNLLPRYTAIENVMLPLGYSGIEKHLQKQMATDALAQVGLSDRMQHRPNELSGGQRQRVAIARALVNSPSIILADEPTGNLDSHSAESIMELLHDIHQKGNTVLIVTHDNAIAESAQRVVALKDGEIVSDIYNKTGTGV